MYILHNDVFYKFQIEPDHHKKREDSVEFCSENKEDVDILKQDNKLLCAGHDKTVTPRQNSLSLLTFLLELTQKQRRCKNRWTIFSYDNQNKPLGAGMETVRTSYKEK